MVHATRNRVGASCKIYRITLLLLQHFPTCPYPVPRCMFKQAWTGSTYNGYDKLLIIKDSNTERSSCPQWSWRGQNAENMQLFISGMFRIKFTGSIIISAIFFSWSFLPVLAWKTTEKTMENFSGSPKYDAKHWTHVEINLKLRFLIKSGYYIEPSPSTALRNTYTYKSNFWLCQSTT